MNCVILAAGKNIRLDNGIPKSLSIVNEKSLLERHISLFRKYGVTQFSVVIGYRGEMIRQHAQELSLKYDINITCIENPSYELPNGHSLYASKDWLITCKQREFLFVMADHYFEEEFLQKFMESLELKENEILKLAVDKPGTHNKYIDLEDVTKVLARADKIIKIGKELEEYNYYDTGLFYVKNEVFEILEKNFAEGKESISNMVQEIVERDGSVISNISGYYWNDIDTPLDLGNTKSSVETSEKRHLQQVQLPI